MATCRHQAQNTMEVYLRDTSHYDDITMGTTAAALREMTDIMAVLGQDHEGTMILNTPVVHPQDAIRGIHGIRLLISIHIVRETRETAATHLQTTADRHAMPETETIATGEAVVRVLRLPTMIMTILGDTIGQSTPVLRILA